MGKKECSLPVGFFDCLSNNIGVNSTFKGLFGVRVKMILDVGIIGMFSIVCQLVGIR